VKPGLGSGLPAGWGSLVKPGLGSGLPAGWGSLVKPGLGSGLGSLRDGLLVTMLLRVAGGLQFTRRHAGSVKLSCQLACSFFGRDGEI
jgi:hypothetical protein